MTFQTFDAEYLERLRGGDAATEQHFAEYFGELLHLKLRSRVRTREALEDIRQETLLRVLRKIREGNGVHHPERFGAFVNAVCNNVMREERRAGMRDIPAPAGLEDPPDPSADLDQPLVAWERKQWVRRMLAELPEKDRELLRALYLEEKSKGEVCRRFNVANDYLRVLLHRARKRFRDAAHGIASPD